MREELQSKLVLFEDDKSILSMLSEYLRNAGAEVLAFSDGRDAVRIITEEAPDVVIMDVVMPVQDGFSIVKELREHNVSTPVILLTDKSSIDDRVFGLESGADDYVCKPFSPKELMARVNVHLRRGHGGIPTGDKTLIFQELQINPQTREINGAGTPLSLTKTEFDLLHYLVTQFPAVISYESIYKEVLGYRPDVETKALVMHVMNLRKKLRNSQVTSFEIKAVAGVGYKLVKIE